MSSWAKPGVKCVFIGLPEGKEVCHPEQITIPDKGAILTIRDVVARDEYVALRFHEIRNPVVQTWDGMMERGYEAYLFRPLVSQQDDIAMFKAIIAPTPELVVMPDLEHMGSD